MKKISILAFVILFFMPLLSFSASFKVYPGAQLEDVYETKQQPEPGKILKTTTSKEIIFTTNAPFESVVAFYRGEGREYRVPGSGGNPIKLSTGQELKEAYFIFDNAADIMTSKHWVKIQRPYLSRERTKDGFQGRYQGTREVTAIIEEDKRSYKD